MRPTVEKRQKNNLILRVVKLSHAEVNLSQNRPILSSLEDRILPCFDTYCKTLKFVNKHIYVSLCHSNSEYFRASR